MSDDARFEDAQGALPLRLMVVGEEDLAVVSSLVQDAVVQASDMNWLKRERRFALLLNRFRWEDSAAAKVAGRPLERVQSILYVDGVLNAQTQGVSPGDADTVLSLLSVTFAAGEDAAGVVELTFAGDGALRFDVECLDVKLKDVSRPYEARAQRVPKHDLD